MKTIYLRFKKSVFILMSLLLMSSLHTQATKVTINVQNFFFSPSTFSINLGDTVVWNWINGTHTTTSLTIPGGAVAWDSPISTSTKKYTYVPAVVGTYNYKCTPHFVTQGMQGNFTVVCPTPSVTISAGGPTTFCKGSEVLLSVSSGGPFSSYQWKLDGINITGATASSYAAKSSGGYTLTITNNCLNTATSNSIAVTANKKPKADITPSGPQTICAGETLLLTVSSANNQTYQWKNGNANIPGATNTTLLVSAAGSYKCKVTKTNTGCTKTSKPVDVSVTCKNSEPLADLLVYPNPSSDYFLINTSALSLQNGRISTYDITGKLMDTYDVVNETTVIGKNLPAGVYFAKIFSEGKTVQVLKLIKN